MTTIDKGPGTVRAAQAAETRRRLIAAAVTLFSKTNFDDVAVADIAKEAGVAHGLLFHYFGSKRGIYLETMRETAAELDAAFVVDPTLPPARQLREALAAHLRYLAAHRGLALRLVLGGRGADPEAWEVFEAARQRALYNSAAAFGLDPNNRALRMMGRAAVGAIDEASIYWLENEQPFAIDALVESMVAMLASALRAAHDLDPSLEVGAALSALFDEREATNRTHQPDVSARRRARRK
jgi:AcrR family transcriptional regulator